MKVLMVKSSMAAGKGLVAGKEYEVKDKDASVLIAYGKAVDLKDEEAVKEAKGALKRAADKAKVRVEATRGAPAK